MGSRWSGGKTTDEYARTVVLVAGEGEQREAGLWAARELYVGEWFGWARRYARLVGKRGFVLSGRYGLLRPGQVLAPYERRLGERDGMQRRDWAREVLRVLAHYERIRGGAFVVLAGAVYREFLVPLLLKNGAIVEVPMAGMGIGEQIAWLKGEVGRLEGRAVQLGLGV